MNYSFYRDRKLHKFPFMDGFPSEISEQEINAADVLWQSGLPKQPKISGDQKRFFKIKNADGNDQWFPIKDEKIELKPIYQPSLNSKPRSENFYCGMKIKHSTFGIGELVAWDITSGENNLKLHVVFPEKETKILMARYCEF